MLTNANPPRLHPKQCKSILEKARWNNDYDMLTPTCVYCGSKKISKHKISGQNIKYHCQSCNNSFTLFTNTFLHNIKIDITKLIAMFYMIKLHHKKYTIREITKLDFKTIAIIQTKLNHAIKMKDSFACNIIGSIDIK